MDRKNYIKTSQKLNDNLKFKLDFILFTKFSYFLRNNFL